MNWLSVRMVWTLHKARVLLCAISKFWHFSWFPICDTEAKRLRLQRNFILLTKVWSMQHKYIANSNTLHFVTYWYMCKLHIFATTKINAIFAKSESHCLVSFHRRVNGFITLVIIASEKCPPFSEYYSCSNLATQLWQVEAKYCTSKLQLTVTVNTGVNCSW